MTMVEARVPAAREAELVASYEALDEPPPFIVESFLLHVDGSDLWRLATVFTSREELDQMREQMQAAGEVPPGIRVFTDVGVEPTVTIFDVIARIKP